MEMTNTLHKFQQASDKQWATDKADDISHKERRLKEPIEQEVRREETLAKRKRIDDKKRAASIIQANKECNKRMMTITSTIIMDNNNQ